MGCGQSKIGNQKRNKNKNSSKRSGEDGDSEEEPEDADGATEDTKEIPEDKEIESENDVVSCRIKELSQQQQQQTGGTALLPQSDISSSQLDFFKMLDEKIENGPDYIEDEEEERARLTDLLQEWKAVTNSRHQKTNGHVHMSPARPQRGYSEDYPGYGPRISNQLDTQRFPTGYSSCPPNPDISMHLHNTFKVPYPEPVRMRPMNCQLPRPPFTNYVDYSDPRVISSQGNMPYNHCDEGEPPRPNFPHVLMRQNTAPQHYPESQRLYQYQEPPSRLYQTPVRNIMHEQRLYRQEPPSRPYPEPQRQYVDNQRVYIDRRPYVEPPVEVQRNFQRPPLMTQRSFQEPRMYRDIESDNYQRPYQERFNSGPEERSRSPLKMIGRAASMDMQYVPNPPPPMEIVPLQGGPGPPVGSPRPRGIQMSQGPRFPSNSVVQYRKSRGAFTELA